MWFRRPGAPDDPDNQDGPRDIALWDGNTEDFTLSLYVHC